MSPLTDFPVPLGDTTNLPVTEDPPQLSSHHLFLFRVFMALFLIPTLVLVFNLPPPWSFFLQTLLCRLLYAQGVRITFTLGPSYTSGISWTPTLFSSQACLFPPASVHTGLFPPLSLCTASQPGLSQPYPSSFSLLFCPYCRIMELPLLIAQLQCWPLLGKTTFLEAYTGNQETGKKELHLILYSFVLLEFYTVCVYYLFSK